MTASRKNNSSLMSRLPKTGRGLFALIFSCFGCQVTNERFIVGTYRAEARCVTITLELNRDRSFVQSVRTTTGETKELIGIWGIDERSIDHQKVKTVNFDSFLDFHLDYHGRQGGPGGTGFFDSRKMSGLALQDRLHQVEARCQETLWYCAVICGSRLRNRS